MAHCSQPKMCAMDRILRPPRVSSCLPRAGPTKSRWRGRSFEDDDSRPDPEGQPSGAQRPPPALPRGPHSPRILFLNGRLLNSFARSQPCLAKVSPGSRNAVLRSMNRGRFGRQVAGQRRSPFENSAWRNVTRPPLSSVQGCARSPHADGEPGFCGCPRRDPRRPLPESRLSNGHTHPGRGSTGLLPPIHPKLKRNLSLRCAGRGGRLARSWPGSSLAPTYGRPTCGPSAPPGTATFVRDIK